MRLTVRFFIFCLMLIGSWGCSQKSAKLQKSVVPPDKTLFETGSEYLEKSQWDSLEHLEKNQLSSIKKLLIHAYENSSFYKHILHNMSKP